jgi:voltage-gated potassium channel
VTPVGSSGPTIRHVDEPSSERLVAAPAMPGPDRRAVAVAGGRTLLTVGGVLVLYGTLPLEGRLGVGALLVLLGGLLVVGVLVAWQVRAILRSRHPALRAVEAIALSLPLFLLLFAAAYVVLSGTDPDAFTEPISRVDGVYFVVTVFATVGFGDISPLSELARALTTVQMVGDLVLIGLVLRIFLTAVDRRRRGTGRAPAPPG